MSRALRLACAVMSEPACQNCYPRWSGLEEILLHVLAEPQAVEALVKLLQAFSWRTCKQHLGSSTNRAPLRRWQRATRVHGATSPHDGATSPRVGATSGGTRSTRVGATSGGMTSLRVTARSQSPSDGTTSPRVTATSPSDGTTTGPRVGATSDGTTGPRGSAMGLRLMWASR